MDFIHKNGDFIRPEWWLIFHEWHLTLAHITRIVCIRPKGRTQCIFPRSQHRCLYVYIYWYQVVVSQQSVRTLFKSLVFLAISDRYATFFFFDFFDKMAAFGHFGCPKFTLDRISDHFKSIGHFGYQKLTNKIFFVDQWHCQDWT